LSSSAYYGTSNLSKNFFIEFPFGYAFTKAKLYFDSNLPYNVKICGSSNNSSYPVLATMTISSNPAEIPLGQNSNIKYIKVEFNSGGTNNKEFYLKEFELTGTTNSAFSIGYDADGNRIETKVITLTSLKAAVGAEDSIRQESQPDVNVDFLGNGELKLFPNPTQSELHICCSLLEIEGQAVQMAVYDINGKIVYGPVRVQSESIVDFSNKAQGVYFVKLWAGENSTEWKIVKK
jgi:hypothetical protein